MSDPVVIVSVARTPIAPAQRPDATTHRPPK